MAEKIIAWLKDHPLISVYGLEQQLQLPEGTISKAVAGSRALPDKHITAIAAALKHYGFK